MSMSLLSELVGDGGAAAAPSGSRAPRSEEAELDRRVGVLAEDEEEEIFSSDDDADERVQRRSWAPEEGKISERNKDRRTRARGR